MPKPKSKPVKVKPVEVDLLEDYLWELTKRIAMIDAGLPTDWFGCMLEELDNIFRPLTKPTKRK